ncbi:cadherin-like beta sandwich domain-containing protein [Cohnella suwonensis]|uniref:Cadherin-like beta sandwich domain-containing protein n=1 Tax=Cohnella suwonensis TaxID=696072 RepID=A0ABW0LW86_9BACL
MDDTKGDRMTRRTRILQIQLKAIVLMLVCAMIVPAVQSQAQAAPSADDTISVVAGTGINGGGNLLDNPNGVAVDGDGNVYIADTNNHRVRKVAPDGTISTIAGNGTAGYLGDGGPATAAELNYPNGVAVDGSGNVYIADSWNGRVRKVAALDGTISTVAGTDAAGNPDDGVVATSTSLMTPDGVAVDDDGNVYIADSGSSRIWKVFANGSISTVAAGPLLNPAGVAVDVDENLYIADSANNRILKVTPNGTISTLTDQVSNPKGVAVDDDGNVYIADTLNHQIQKVTPDSTISTVAGTGTKIYWDENCTAIEAQLHSPAGVAVDHIGNMYIADTSNHVVARVGDNPHLIGLSLSSGTLSPAFSTDTTAYTATVNEDSITMTPTLSISNATVIVNGTEVASGSESDAINLNEGNNTITVVVTAQDGTTKTYTVTVTRAEGASNNADLSGLTLSQGTLAPAFDWDTTSYTAEVGYAVTSLTVTPTTADSNARVTVNGTEVNSGSQSSSINLSESGSTITVVVTAQDGTTKTYTVTVTKAASNNADLSGLSLSIGTVSPSFSASTTSYTVNVDNEITSLTVTPTVADSSARVTVNGQTVTSGSASSSIHLSEGSNTIPIEVTARDGTTKKTYSVTVKVAPVTYYISTVAGTGTGDPIDLGDHGDGGPAVSAQVLPGGVAVDGSGNVYAADLQVNRIRKIKPDGIISSVETGTFNYVETHFMITPYGVAVDGSGNLYIVDGNQIRKVTLNGTPNETISTVAGSGVGGYSGDGGPAVTANLFGPTHVVVDGSGNLYIADTNNSRIRKVATNGTISTVAGTGVNGYSGDGGPAVSAQLYDPTGVAVDGSGNLYIADSANNRIRKVATDGTISTVAGIGSFNNYGYSGDGGPAVSAQLNDPIGVAVDGSGNLYIADSANNRIRKVTPDGTIRTVAGKDTGGYSGDGGSAVSAQLSWPFGVAVDGSGNLYIADTRNLRIRKLTRASSQTADSGAPIQVTPSTPVSIVVPTGVTDAKVAVTTTTVGSNKEATLPFIDVQATTSLGNVSVAIPQGTKITAPASWDGTIKLPVVQINSSVSVNNANVNAVIEVGSSDVSLTFDHAVRLLIPNMGGKSAGYVRNGVFTPITNTISADTQAAADRELAAGGDAKITVGSDLVIWTKHFTQFAAYTPVIPQTGSGGDSGAPANVYTLGALASAEFTLNGIKFSIPEGAADKSIQVTVDKVADISSLPQDASLRLLGDVYEVKKNSNGDFLKPVTIALPFDKSKVDFNKNEVAVYWLNEQTNKWVELDNTQVDQAGGTVSGTITHFTKFSVFASERKQIPSPSASETNLTDIKGHWAEASIRELIQSGAISGYPDQTFKPNNKITRAEFVSILVKAFKLKAPDSKTFADTTDHWAKDSIGSTAALGIATGDGEGNFRPDDPITREEMALIIVRALKLNASAKFVSFKDNSAVSGWAIEAVAAAADKGLLSGYEDGTIRAKANTTRAEAVAVIVRAMLLMKEVIE